MLKNQYFLEYDKNNFINELNYLKIILAIYVIKFIIKKFVFYTYIYKLFTYYSPLWIKIFMLYLLFNKKEIMINI